MGTSIYETRKLNQEISGYEQHFLLCYTEDKSKRGKYERTEIGFNSWGNWKDRE